MSRVAWRGTLVAICVLAAFVEVVRLVNATGLGGGPPWRGTWGANAVNSSIPFNLAITSVDRGGPAGLAGLRRDDLVDIRANSLVERQSLLGVPVNGQPLVLLVRRGPLQMHVTVTPQAPQLTWASWLEAFTAFWLLLFATLIAWKSADNPQMRLLSLWLAAFVLTGALLGIAAPSVWMCVLVAISLSVLGPVSVALLAAFASGFAQPLTRSRRIASLLCYTFLAIFTIISFLGSLGIVTLWFDPLPFAGGYLELIPISAAVLMAVLCGIFAIAASRGLERQRAIWTLVPLAAFYCFFIAAVISSSSSSSYTDSIIVGLVSTVFLLATPVALTYAALSRRLIDVGFFLNRAAVFTIVSLIVVGVLALVEWAVSNWLVGATHATSAFAGMIVALGLGLSISYIQKSVERFVDRVLFRKRHEDAAALRRFAHESSFISDRSTLLARAIEAVKTHTGAGDAVILIRKEFTSFASATGVHHIEVSEDDPVIVALRAWHKPIDLHHVNSSELHGEFALPLASRGELVGALICGPKSDGDSYAPDEIAALLVLAHGVGVALLTERGGDMDVVLKELAELRDEVKRYHGSLGRTQSERPGKEPSLPGLTN